MFNISGEDGKSDIFQSIFINAVSAADDYYQRGISTAQLNFNNGELVDRISQIDFGMELFSGHQTYMQSGFNSFLTLKLAMLPNGLRSQSGKSDILVNSTINGFAGLLRQSLENLVRSVWLLEASSRNEISQRGFAVLWENASNRLKYERALESPQIDEFKKQLEDIRAAGIELGFFEKKKDGDLEFADNPRICIQDASGLLRNVVTPAILPKKLLMDRGIGFVNAEWVYKWLSGLTHGLDWAHLGVAIPDEMDFAFIIRSPDVERFSIAALYVLQLGQELFALTDGTFEANLSSIFSVEATATEMD